jgi:hypothetical protein
MKGMGPIPEGMGAYPRPSGLLAELLVRQVYDMQQGVRKGAWTELMKPVVKQVIAQSAFTANLKRCRVHANVGYVHAANKFSIAQLQAPST